MKLSKKQILDLHNGLTAVGSLGGAKFAYTVARNVLLLHPEIEALQKAYLAKDNYIAYENERQAVAKKNAIKVDGIPQIVKKGDKEEYVIENEELFNKEFLELQENHKPALDERSKQLADFEEILKEEIEVPLHTISPDYIPEGITAKQMADILLIIDEKIVNQYEIQRSSKKS